MFSPIEEIKSRIDIVDLVEGYVRLQKSGVNFKANCPFHSEKTPSFYVTPSRQIWHCFGCSKGGDVFKFIMEIEGHDFPEALRLLAARAGVELKREDPAIRSERNRLYDTCEAAAKVFERTLLLNAPAKEYLKKRGMTEETVRLFRVGFAPQSWDFLTNALVKKGFKKEELEKAGLAARSQDGASWYDRFRSRIMFPIVDANGRVIGFGGRIFEPSGSPKDPEKTEAKYVNTPATPIYDKSNVLYGFDKAKHEIREKNEAVIVEGYMDCVMSHQAGVKNAVAVSGTALTHQQLKMLRRLAEHIVFSFDTDAAGDSATKRSLALAAEFDFMRKIAQIPSGKDPADAVLENSTQWIQAVKEAKSVIQFYFDKAFQNFSTERAEGKKAIAAMILPHIAALPNEIEKAHWVRSVAERLGTPEDAVWKEINKKTLHPDILRRPEKEEERKKVSRREVLEDRLISLLAIMREKNIAPEYEYSRIVFLSAFHNDLFQFLTDKKAGELAASHRDALSLLSLKGEAIVNSVDDLHQEFMSSACELEKACIRDELTRVGGEIKNIEHQGISREREVEPLLQTFKELSAALSKLN
ncbi:MAG: DNA primase [Candidatus Sungbacteria bacterium]|nr:DNA primase [Candidatus Sungbacteria bacterium]